MPIVWANRGHKKNSFQCKPVKKNVSVKGKFTDIFKPKVEQEVAKIAENSKIVKWRENYKEK